MGFSLLWKAPVVLALVVVPEFLQHVFEIQLGMFDSREAFAALAMDPTRMAFGFVKIGGLLLVFFATARFWWTRNHGDGRWWNLRTVAWGRFLLGLLLFAGPTLLVEQTKPLIGSTAASVFIWVVGIATLPFALLIIAGLFGDRQPTIRQVWIRGWLALILICILVPLAYLPAQWLHDMNHRWAFGADPIIVWALMIFDSLLVGLLAGLTGTALYLGYAAFAQRGRGQTRDAA